MNRLSVNLVHFQINYAVVFFGFMVYEGFTHPKSLALMGVLAAAWLAFLKKNADPLWVMRVCGVALGPTQRWLILGVATAVSALSFASQILASAAILWVMFVATHAILHP